MCLMPAFMAP